MSEATPPADDAAARDEEPLYRQPWLRFAVSFAVLVSLFELAYHTLALESALFYDFTSALAHIAGTLLVPFYERVTLTGSRVATNEFVVTVNYGCDGLQVCTLLTAAILAFPAPFGRKLVGIVAGNLWLQTWNVARIASLVVVGGIDDDWFEPVHVYVWPTILVAVCLATWMAWARWILRDDDPEPAPAA